MSEADFTGPNSRGAELLRKAAEAFSDQRSPFCDEWLVENKVTADECFDLSDQIASALRFFLFTTSNVGSLPAAKQTIVQWLLESIAEAPEAARSGA